MNTKNNATQPKPFTFQSVSEADLELVSGGRTGASKRRHREARRQAAAKTHRPGTR